MKNVERSLSQNMRQEGWSIKAIAKELKVSSSSVSRWVQDIELTDMQKLSLESNRRRAGLKSAKKLRENGLMRRLDFQNKGREKAKDKDFFHAAGCMLYWGEGAKGKNTVSIANSDPSLLVFFKSFLDCYFDLQPLDYTIRCKLYTDMHGQQEIEEYWLQTLQLPKSCLRASTVNYYSRHSKNQRRGTLEYGCCTLIVGKTYIVQHIFGAIQKYAEFNNKKWLG